MPGSNSKKGVMGMMENMVKSITKKRKNKVNNVVAAPNAAAVAFVNTTNTRSPSKRESNAINAAAKEARKAKLEAAKAAEAAGTPVAASPRRKTSRRRRETMSEATAFLRKTIKARVTNRRRSNQLAAEEGKKRVKGYSGRGMAAMDHGEFVDFIKSLTEEQLILAQAILMSFSIFKDGNGYEYNYIAIQNDDDAGGDILMHMSEDLINYFVGITERVGLITGRLRRLTLARR